MTDCHRGAEARYFSTASEDVGQTVLAVINFITPWPVFIQLDRIFFIVSDYHSVCVKHIYDVAPDTTAPGSIAHTNTKLYCGGLTDGPRFQPVGKPIH